MPASGWWRASFFRPGRIGRSIISLRDELRERVVGGMRVRAPFGRGNRTAVGYCVRLTNQADVRRKLKAITDVVDSQSLLSPAMLDLTEWMAGRYLSTWGQALETVLPAAVREKAGTRRVKLIALAPDASAKIGELKLSEKQAAIVRFLTEHSAPMILKELTAALDCTTAPIGTLQRKGIVTIETRRMASDEALEAPRRAKPITRSTTISGSLSMPCSRRCTRASRRRSSFTA